MERFKQKLGPLPVWAWAAIGLLAILGYMYWKKVGFFGSGTSPASSAGTPATDSSGNPLSSLLGNQGLMPNPAAYASSGSGIDSGAFGPTVTTYDTSTDTTGTPDRGASPAPTPAPILAGVWPAPGTPAYDTRIAAGSYGPLASGPAQLTPTVAVPSGAPPGRLGGRFA